MGSPALTGIGSLLALDRFHGAPLDLIKVAALALMVGDHVNTILLDGQWTTLWRLGRIAFPLFCLVSALHLARGADPGRYVLALLLVAIPTQPIYALAFPYGTTEGSILFTLATGAAFAAFVSRAGAFVRHGAFAIGLGLVFGFPSLAKTGVDFGMAGILLPAALGLVLRQPRTYGCWLVATVVGLNWHGWHPRGEDPTVSALLDAGTILAGLCVVVGAAAALYGRPRFLPASALQIFYPAHLLALSAIRAVG